MIVKPYAKRRILLLISVFLVNFISAHSQQIKLISDTITIGKNLITGEHIHGIEYVLPQALYSYQLDSIDRHLTLALRQLSRNGKRYKKQGWLLEYDLQQCKILWQRELNYRKEFLGLEDGLIIYAGKGLPYVLNKHNGKRDWILKNNLILKDSEKKIGIGYELYSTEQSKNMLEGISLEDGTTIWRREISRKYGWDDLKFLNDSTMLIAASGLHTVNLTTGEGWDYNMITGDEDYTKSAIVSALGIASGLLTGSYFIQTGADIVHYLSSNILNADRCLYIASAQKITKLNRSGKVIWEISLPLKHTSASRLFISGNDLVMLNMGYAKKENRIIKYGESYLASYNRETGNINYRTNLHSIGKGIISNYCLADNYIILVFDDRIEKYDLHTGELQAKTKFDIFQYGQIDDFINGSHWYEYVNEDFQTLAELGSGKHFLMTEENKIAMMNSMLEVEHEMLVDSLYILHRRCGELQFITNGEESFVLDKFQNQIARIPDAWNLNTMNGQLYVFQKERIIVVDLEEFSSEYRQGDLNLPERRDRL